MTVRLRLMRWGPSLLAAVIGVIALSVVVESVALISRSVSSPGPNSSGAARLLDPWNRWDADWFLRIARDGYIGTGRISPLNGAYQDALAFPPLFPLAIRGVAAMLRIPLIGAAELVDVVSLFAALAGLYRLAELDAGHRAAGFSLLALLTFPTAFFLIAPYAEALVIALGVWSFLAARTGLWRTAAGLAALAVVAKIYAVVLVPALLVELAGSRRPGGWRREATWLVVLPALALSSWMAYQAYAYGDPLRFLTAEAAWGRSLSAPMWYAWSGVDFLNASRRDLLPMVLDVVAPLVLAAAGVWAYRHVRRSYGVLLLLSAVVISSTSNHFSVSRYALGAFPLFLVAGRLYATRPRIALAVSSLTACLGGVMVMLFTTGWFVG